MAAGPLATLANTLANGRTAALAGIALLLALAALVPAAASRVPTEIVELEDPQVWKSGGHVHPDRWVIERTRYRGGWVLRVGEQLKVPVVPGGRRVRLRLEAEFIRNQPVPFTLDLKAGDRMIASWTPARGSGCGKHGSEVEMEWRAAASSPSSQRDGDRRSVLTSRTRLPGAGVRRESLGTRGLDPLPEARVADRSRE